MTALVTALVTALAGCGDDIAALAESPPEPTIWASVGRDGVVGMAGEIHFAGGAVVGPRVFAPAMARPGEVLHVQFAARGIAGKALWVGLRAPRAAGRQEVAGQSRRSIAAVNDPRDRWVQASVGDGSASATIEVPGEWHAMHAVVLVELRDGTDAVPVRGGPRVDRGPGVLGVVAVVVGPTKILAPGVKGVIIDGRVEEAAWARPAQVLTTSLEGEPDPGATATEPGALGDDALAAGRGTTVRVGWDAESLYVAASLPDLDLWTEYAAQDDPLYKQEAFELFVAAGAVFLVVYFLTDWYGQTRGAGLHGHTITGAGVLQISPANTSPDFTIYPDKGLYFRVPPDRGTRRGARPWSRAAR